MINDIQEVLVTIVVPVFNVKNYIDKCIGSIRQQTHSAVEIILVDDGSTDGCGEICNLLAEEDKRIRVIHQNNRGLSCARNTGIDHAHGEYICFIDSDDSIDRTFVEQLLFMCIEYKSEVSVCNYFYVTETEFVLLPQSCEEVKIYSGEDAVRQCCQYPNDGIFNIAWNKLYKRELFDEVRYPNGKIHEDEFTTYKLLAKCKNVAATDRCLYYYLQRDGSIMNECFSPKRLDKLEALRERLSFLKNDTYKNEYVKTLFHAYGFLQSASGKLKENGLLDERIDSFLKKNEKELREQIINLKDVDMLRKVRAIYKNLSEKEKAYYKAQYGNALNSWNTENYLFPFHLIQQGARILLYGAGGVGKAYYRQIISTSYARICAWVDAFWVLPKNNGYPVCSISQGLVKKYDYVVIALRDRVTAERVRCNLLDWGVDKNRIIWSDPIIPGILDVCEAEKKSLKVVNKTRLFLINTPDYGNLGDHAIVIAEKSFLEDYFGDYEIIEISGKEWDKWQNIYRAEITDKDIISFTGGGYMGNLWQIESCRINEIIRDFPNNKKIFFPQSLYYEKKGWNSKYDFIDSNTLFIHRERISMNAAKSIKGFKHGKNECFPDMVLYLHPNVKKCKRDGILICTRKDKEKITNNDISRVVEDFAGNNDTFVLYTDTVLSGWNQEKNRQVEFEEMLDKFSSVRLVVTDRLHGMIFSAITGTPCLAFDNLTGKVGGVYEIIKSLPYIRICKGDEKIKDELTQLYAMKDVEYPEKLLKEKFSEMASCMRAWMETRT